MSFWVQLGSCGVFGHGMLVDEIMAKLTLEENLLWPPWQEVCPLKSWLGSPGYSCGKFGMQLTGEPRLDLAARMVAEPSIPLYLYWLWLCCFVLNKVFRELPCSSLFGLGWFGCQASCLVSDRDFYGSLPAISRESKPLIVSFALCYPKHISRNPCKCPYSNPYYAALMAAPLRWYAAQHRGLTVYSSIVAL